MTSIERENFLRHAILVVDHSKAALVSLVELDMANKGQTFEQFVNTNQHEIYHLYSSMCCQCSPGHYPSRSSRILHQSQIELLFDRSLKLPCHNKARRLTEFCCSMAKVSLCTDVLDLTLAKCLLFNFCDDVFWFSCLQFKSNTFEDFLNNNKHELYHLWQNNAPCCQCMPGYTFPTKYSVLDKNDLMKMFNAVLLPCTNHRKRPRPGDILSIYSVAAAPGITLSNIDPLVSRIILQHCCTLRMAVETLIHIRNQDYGHAKEGVMSDNDYNTSVAKIELLKCVTRKHNLSRNYSVANIEPCLCEIRKKIAEKAGKIPKLMDECVRKGLPRTTYGKVQPGVS
ncbi:unnamed protein product [Mytilus edulis]|uniref:Uncharacterized protein n=1 Tax=Mytilus edulis TaxID=6550 RepID=A0A8S3RNA9_MYTED|nr:unnamed protein product [Mytilus edulis]